MAVAAAAYEDEVVNGWTEARQQFASALVEAGEPDDGNPFGPDPARSASVGRRDDGHYYAPSPEPPKAADLPPRPVTAAGQVS